eukprot:comp18822_c0_seq1/m.34327 comp18822_c0_seq1/g.34327  ORF comp18822_c0_seq1/g.34327 comp18822_c0_seq1/m.34327 type:complete len:311 (-) comp18822_c0_seq1:102-1034(-)
MHHPAPIGTSLGAALPPHQLHMDMQIRHSPQSSPEFGNHHRSSRESGIPTSVPLGPLQRRCRHECISGLARWIRISPLPVGRQHRLEPRHLPQRRRSGRRKLSQADPARNRKHSASNVGLRLEASRRCTPALRARDPLWILQHPGSSTSDSGQHEQYRNCNCTNNNRFRAGLCSACHRSCVVPDQLCPAWAPRDEQGPGNHRHCRLWPRPRTRARGRNNNHPGDLHHTSRLDRAGSLCVCARWRARGDPSSQRGQQRRDQACGIGTVCQGLEGHPVSLQACLFIHRRAANTACRNDAPDAARQDHLPHNV